MTIKRFFLFIWLIIELIISFFGIYNIKFKKEIIKRMKTSENDYRFLGFLKERLKKSDCKELLEKRNEAKRCFYNINCFRFN